MKRWLMLAALLAALASAALIAQLVIAPIAAQPAQAKVTGKVVDKVIKTFDAAGLPGVHSIEYREFSMSQGAGSRATSSSMATQYSRGEEGQHCGDIPGRFQGHIQGRRYLLDSRGCKGEVDRRRCEGWLG